MRTDIIGIYFYFFFVLKQDLDLLHENMKSVLFCFLRDPKRLEDDGHWKKCRRWYSSSSTNRPLITMHLPQSNTNTKSEHHCVSDMQCWGWVCILGFISSFGIWMPKFLICQHWSLYFPKGFNICHKSVLLKQIQRWIVCVWCKTQPTFRDTALPSQYLK